MGDNTAQNADFGLMPPDLLKQLRIDAQRQRAMWQENMKLLEDIASDPARFERLGERMDLSGPDEAGRWEEDKVNQVYRKTISLSSRIKSTRDLAQMLEKMIQTEKGLYPVNDKKMSKMDELLMRVAKERGR